VLYTLNELGFGRPGRRVIKAKFSGGALSSDGGLMLCRCERSDAGYVKRSGAQRPAAWAVRHWEEQLRQRFEQTGIKQRAIHEFRYGAKRWQAERRVITRLAFSHQEISFQPFRAVDPTSLGRGLHPLPNGYGRNPGLQAGFRPPHRFFRAGFQTGVSFTIKVPIHALSSPIRVVRRSAYTTNGTASVARQGTASRKSCG
jgi:hypothetical protein